MHRCHSGSSQSNAWTNTALAEYQGQKYFSGAAPTQSNGDSGFGAPTLDPVRHHLEHGARRE
jgi:hypothetical protein